LEGESASTGLVKLLAWFVVQVMNRNPLIPQCFSNNTKPRGGIQPYPRVKEKRSNGINIRSDDVYPAS